MATDAEKVKMYREKAKDTSIPQEVRNTYLDRANELERKAFEDSKGAPPPAKLAKGGMPVRGSRTATNKEKKMMGGGYAMPEKPTMMSKGGAAMMKKKYASGGVAMPMVKKDGMDVPAFAADGKGKMAKGGAVTKVSSKKPMIGMYMEFSNKGKPKGMTPVKTATLKKGK